MDEYRLQLPGKENARRCDDDDDFKPRGLGQADLCLLASSELARKHCQYLLASSEAAETYVARVSAAGGHADSRSMCALAQVAQVVVHIWAYSDEFQRWNLYSVGPWRLKKGQASSTTGG